MRLFPSHNAKASPLPTEITLDGAPPLIVKIRPHKRARRLSLQVSPHGGDIFMTIPPAISCDHIYKFIKDKEGWLRRIHAQITPYEQVRFGIRFPFQGRKYILCPKEGQGDVMRTDDKLFIGGERIYMAVRLRVFLKTHAHICLLFASEKYATQLGQSFSTITLRDPRTRWGSCSSKGRLMYSWRLIMAPNHVLDYVAAHEVAHLAHMNHSRKFWDTVKQLCPDYETARRWLHTQGRTLHKWKFDD